MQPEFFTNHSGKFFVAAVVAIAMLASLFSDSISGLVIQLVGRDGLAPLVIGLLAYIGFVAGAGNLRTEDEFNRQMKEKYRALKRKHG